MLLFDVGLVSNFIILLRLREYFTSYGISLLSPPVLNIHIFASRRSNVLTVLYASFLQVERVHISICPCHSLGRVLLKWSFKYKKKHLNHIKVSFLHYFIQCYRWIVYIGCIDTLFTNNDIVESFPSIT